MNQVNVYSKRAARQLDGVTVKIANASAAREVAEATAAAQQATVRAEQIREEARAERTERRRRRRAARWAERRAQVGRRGVLVATLAVIVLLVSVALPAQISFLAQRWPLPMALSGGIALEALTWVFALQGRAREACGLSAAVHHLGIWAAAGVAAGVNLTHGAQMWGFGFAVVAATGSLAAPVTWHMYLWSQRADVSDPETVRLNRRRRRHHRSVARMADRLVTALPSDMTTDQAWVLAWRAVHGAEPGITAELLRGHASAAERVAQHLRPGVTASLALLEGPLVAMAELKRHDPMVVVQAGFAAARPLAELLSGGVSTSTSERTWTAGEPAYNQVSDRAATRTTPPERSRTSSVQPRSEVAIEAKRRAARDLIRRTLAWGGTPSPTEIGRLHGLSPEWGSKQIRAVREEQRHRAANTAA